MSNATTPILPDYCQGIGKGEIVREGIFERFPELIPAVGEHYWREDGKHRKLLLIGESNYFQDYPETVSVFKDSKKWYQADTDKLIPEEMKKAVSNWIDYKTFNKVFDIMNSVLDARGIERMDGLHEAAFYNYFLRPALNDGQNKGFKPDSLDKGVAGMALAGIINNIKPQLVIFLSKLAFDEFDYYYKTYCPGCINQDDVNIQHVYHPSSAWWNKDNGSMGHARFRQLLEEYWCK